MKKSKFQNQHPGELKENNKWWQNEKKSWMKNYNNKNIPKKYEWIIDRLKVERIS